MALLSSLQLPRLHSSTWQQVVATSIAWLKSPLRTEPIQEICQNVKEHDFDTHIDMNVLSLLIITIIIIIILFLLLLLLLLLLLSLLLRIIIILLLFMT